MKKFPKTSRVLAALKNPNDESALRTDYCYQIGITFTTLALMEDTIIRAMAMCDRIRVAHVLGSDEPKWREMVNKTAALQDSTLGNLISILSKHGLLEDDVRYLKWLKGKRDFFIHRFFNENH